MELAENTFSSFYETLNNNIIPIAIVLFLVISVLGWMLFNSFNTPVASKEEVNSDNKKVEENYTEESEKEEDFEEQEENVNNVPE
jgi:hypothetical protein